MLKYILKNKEWIFSGVGIFILGSLFTLIQYLVRRAKQRRDHKGLSTESINTIATRFINLCEAHGVHRNQIPKVFCHNMNFADVESDKTLLPKLNDDMLNSACHYFNVNRAWLDGASTQIYPTYDFYKRPDEFVSFVENIVIQNKNSLSAVLLNPSKNKPSDLSVIILEETIGYIEDEPYFRYYLLGNWSISYWKSRAYLTSCIAHLWSLNICIYGLTLSGTFIESISEGKELLAFGNAGIHSLKGKRWYVEDMTIKPDIFLNGIDPEANNFGVIAGLEKWLELESTGHMHSGLGDKNTKHKFEIELKKLV